MIIHTFIVIAAVFVLLLVPSLAAAQTEVARAVTGTSTEKPTTDVGHKLEVLEQQLREQSEKLDKLMAVVAEQQRVITELQTHNTANLASTTTAATSATTKTAAAANTEASSTPAQTPTVEDRLKKLDERVTKIGPFRFSGDFRLRFDGTFRRAEPNPPTGFAPLTHVQNVRMRYRLRLNFDADIDPKFSFHGQLATGSLTTGLSTDQDFGAVGIRHPFFINEAWIDYHPNSAIQLQAGRLQNIFADNSKFLFDDEMRFNGFNEKYVFTFKNNGVKVSSLELRAGQYILSNPNVAIVTAGSPLAQAGAIIGSTGRSSNLFHQGLLINQKYNDRWSSQLGGDLQLYRNPNQLQLASTANGVALIVNNTIGLTLAGPIAGTGTATTTPGGAIYTAPSFKVARLTYRLNWAGFQSGSRTYPLTFNFQAARNVGIGLPERDAMLASIQVGRVVNRGDMAFLYVFSRKGANSMISQVTDDDLGTISGVNNRTHYFRFEYGLTKKITWQSLFYIQNELRNSGDFPNFFVPLNAFTPRQYRFQQQFVFTF
jgi:uncharacterized coiled-coil protein SlyX